MPKHCKELTRGKPREAQTSVLQLKLDFGFDVIVFVTESVGRLFGFFTMPHNTTDTGTNTGGTTGGGTTGGGTTTE